MAQRRVVRRATLLTRLKSYPLDTYLHLHEQLETIDWDKLSDSVSLPTGFILDGLLLFCRLAISTVAVRQDERSEIFWDSSKLRNSPIAGDVLQGRGGKRGFRGWLTGVLSVISIAILLLSFINAYYIFSRRRTYTFLGRAPQDTKLAGNSSATKSQLNLDYNTSTPSSSPWKKIADKFSHAESSPAADSDKDVWELHMWNPQLFNLYLFTAFSPLHTMILFNTTYSTLIRNMVVCLLISGQIYLLTTSFLQQIMDKSLVFGEMFEEYEKKVVRPKMSVVRRDVAVGTDGSVEYCSPALGRQFVTRDIRPRHSSVSFGAVSSPQSSSSSPYTRSPMNSLPPQSMGHWDRSSNGTHGRSPVKNHTGHSGDVSKTSTAMDIAGATTAYAPSPLSYASSAPSRRMK
ncbi:hypothetical protein V1525DRAFT_174401 [Lipomyces kononenkoae]|uniref:Uncharacterized protein n=1 Tax=Lipomyces kononenkoae TaxID=34357 RepID=A0ACC3SZW9_LIPKO